MTQGRIIQAADAEREALDWGALAWLSRPATTGARNLVVLEVTLAPGKHHSFHKHRDQEEVIYVIEGCVEQWLDKEKQTIGPGGAVFIPAGTVHATFNDADCDARCLAILGPSAGEGGYELVDVSEEEPWTSLR